jgi:transcriptional regulator with XRE-family HTH domain
MSKGQLILMPKQQKLLEQLGERLKLARLRRRLSTFQVSERAGITRTTLWNIEKGAPQVAIGYYCQVLFVLGMAEDLIKIAIDDELGRRLQDAELVIKKRAPKKKS